MMRPYAFCAALNICGPLAVSTLPASNSLWTWQGRWGNCEKSSTFEDGSSFMHANIVALNNWPSRKKQKRSCSTKNKGSSYSPIRRTTQIGKRLGQDWRSDVGAFAYP